MVSYADVEKLLVVHREDPPVLSLYLQVPVNMPALRGLSARAGGLLAEAAEGTEIRDAGWVLADVRAVPDLVEEVAVSTIHDGGQVQAVPGPPGGIAATLRIPVSTSGRT